MITAQPTCGTLGSSSVVCGTQHPSPSRVVVAEEGMDVGVWVQQLQILLGEVVGCHGGCGLLWKPIGGCCCRLLPPTCAAAAGPARSSADCRGRCGAAQRPAWHLFVRLECAKGVQKHAAPRAGAWAVPGGCWRAEAPPCCVFRSGQGGTNVLKGLRRLHQTPVVVASWQWKSTRSDRGCGSLCSAQYRDLPLKAPRPHLLTAAAPCFRCTRLPHSSIAARSQQAASCCLSAPRRPAPASRAPSTGTRLRRSTWRGC